MQQGLQWLGGFAVVSALLLAALALGLYVYQDNMLYFPNLPSGSRHPDSNPSGYRNPAEVGLPYEDIFVTAADGIKVHGWLVKQQGAAAAAAAAAAPTILYFHGNAGNIGYRLMNVREMYGRLGCNFLMAEYRGYGRSQGTPTEQGLLLDAEAFVRALHTQTDLGIDPQKIVLFGRSLGGAVAMAAAAAHPDAVAAVIVENTFLSISHMVDALMPAVSSLKRFVLKLKWDSASLAPQIEQPVLLLSGGRDELVPPWHMRRLHNLLTRSSLVAFHLVPGGTHNDTWLRGGPAYYDAIADFLARVARLRAWDDLPQTPTSNPKTSSVAEQLLQGSAAADAAEGVCAPGEGEELGGSSSGGGTGGGGSGSGGVELTRRRGAGGAGGAGGGGGDGSGEAGAIPIMPQIRVGGGGAGLKDD